MDDLDRLRNNDNLLSLLTHYANLGREAWQDRLMAMDGVEPKELSKLHGELIAFSWIEQNTGSFPVLRAGAVPSCYRVTLAGLRAVQEIQAPGTTFEVAQEEPVVKKFKGKKKKKDKEPEMRGAVAA